MVQFHTPARARAGLGLVLVLLLVGGLLAPAAAQTPPISTPSPGSTLTTTTVTFAGGHVAVAGEQHWLSVSRSSNGTDLFHQATGTSHTQEVTGLPTSGTIYVRWWTYTPAQGWLFIEHTYTMNVSGGNTGGDAGNHTLRWDRILDASNGSTVAGQEGCNSDRFKCVFGGAAVLDLETGLVWDRSPDAIARNWTFSISHCATREVGGRKGWDLPLRNQLASLVDGSNSSPSLPTGHPFLTVQLAAYWSASTNAGSPSNAWTVETVNGGVLNANKVFGLNHAWCVRGGQVYDGQAVLQAP